MSDPDALLEQHDIDTERDLLHAEECEGCGELIPPDTSRAECPDGIAFCTWQEHQAWHDGNSTRCPEI